MCTLECIRVVGKNSFYSRENGLMLEGKNELENNCPSWKAQNEIGN